MSNPFEVVAEMTATVYEGGDVVLSSSEEQVRFSVGDLVYVTPSEHPNRHLPEMLSGVVEQVLPYDEYVVCLDDHYAQYVAPYYRVLLEAYEMNAGGVCDYCYKLHSTTKRVHVGYECIIIGGSSRMIYADLCASCDESATVQEGAWDEPTQSGIGYDY